MMLNTSFSSWVYHPKRKKNIVNNRKIEEHYKQIPQKKIRYINWQFSKILAYRSTTEVGRA